MSEQEQVQKKPQSDRIKKFRHSDRKHRASRLIAPHVFGIFWCYKDDPENQLPPEPSYLTVQDYAHHVKAYENFRYDYTVEFEQDEGDLWPGNWRNHSDIAIEMIERKMPIDAPIRDMITGIRMILNRNQWRHILMKRFILIIALIAILFQFYYYKYNGPVFFPFEAFAAIAFIMSAQYFITNILNGRLISAMETAAGRLNNALGNRHAAILSSFQSALLTANNARNDLSPRDIGWIEEALWQIRVSLWLPKRVNYNERYLQIEMQNIRAFRKITDTFGTLFTLIGTGLLIYFFIYTQRLILIESFSSSELTEDTIHFLVSIGALFVSTWLSVRPKSSVLIRDIRKWVGQRQWKSFADFQAFENTSNVMKTYMHRVYTEDNKGSQ